jgi:type IV pilus assembly protein PilE
MTTSGAFSMRKQSAGVTLMELMIVMLIVGILAAIAYPSYRAQILKSNRSEAKIGLQQMVQTLERCYTRTNDYTACVGACAACVTLPYNTPNGYYQITAAPAPTANSYTLVATAIGQQTDDAQCTSFSTTNTDIKSAAGTGGVAVCWR